MAGNKGRGVTRSRKNKLRSQWRIVFCERTYNGSPRWYSRSWYSHVKQVKGDSGYVLNREPGVKKMYRQSHDPSLLFDYGRFDVLWTCVNPECKARAQSIATRDFMIKQYRGRRDEFKRTLNAHMRGLALAKMHKNMMSCDTCAEKIRSLPVNLIHDRWIYVLKEKGDKLDPYCEVYCEEPEKGRIYSHFDGKVFTNKRSKPFRGYLQLRPNPASETWHFFLSPVRLGKEGIELLRRGPAAQQALMSELKKAAKTKGLAIDPKLQPWSTTVKRKFDKEAIKKPVREFIPLVDPFAWAAQVTDFDYLPILAAQQKLVGDPEEQSKAFIASVLQQAIGRKKVSDNPPSYEESDKWDIKDDTLKKTEWYGYTKGTNVAEAWVERYKESVEYLADETNKACARLTMVLRYSIAHRIVELGCQDGGQEPRRLSIGLLHWLHVSDRLLACEEGRRFLTWLTSTKSAAGKGDMAANSRIPTRNLLKGVDLKPGSKVLKEVGLGPLVSLLGTLGPNIVAGSQDPGSALVRHLANFDIAASSLKGKDLQSARDFTLSVGSGLVDDYIKKFPKDVNFQKAQKLTVATTWKKRLTLLGHMSDFDNAMSLLLTLSAMGKKGRRDEGTYDRYARIKGDIEAPVKVASFLAKQSRALLQFNLDGTAKQAAKLIDEHGAKAAIMMMEPAQYEAALTVRSLKVYKLIGGLTRVIAGPVGILLGGVEVVVQAGKTLDSWEAGDPGAAVGAGIGVVAGVMMLTVAGAECAALIGGAAVASWAGPVGWIAAGLMLISALIISIWSKNDLELFARHCFLGPDYGGGGSGKTGKAWMAGLGWKELRYSGTTEARDRFQRQRLALLRMMSGYRTYIGPSSFGGGQVNLGQYTDTTQFEVTVVFRPKGKKSPEETFKAVVWPASRKSIWIGQQPGYGTSISFFTAGKRTSAFEVKAKPRNLGSGRMYYELAVRQDLDGKRKFYLPHSKKYVRNDVTKGMIYNIETSDAVD